MQHAGAVPTCRRCDAPIDVDASGFVDLTMPLCARCSGAPGFGPASDAPVLDLAAAEAKAEADRLPSRPRGRAHRTPVIRDLVRSVVGGASATALATRTVPADVGLAPATVDLRDGAPASPSRPTVWEDAAERRGLRELLNRTRPLGIEVLHDRRPPGAMQAIDHLVVAPSGVWVIDSMGDTGRLQGCEATDFLRPAWRLVVGGVDRTVLLDDVRRRAGAVRDVLVDNGEGRVPVRPILCFSDAALGSVTPPFVMAGVLVTSRRHVVEPFSIAPGLDRAGRRWVRDLLADNLDGVA